MIRKEDFQLLCSNARKLQADGMKKSAERIPNSLILKLTTECNISCDYCYMGNSTNKVEQLDFERALQIIDIFDQLSSRPLTIYLHGGEPCLRKDLIEKLGEAVGNNRFINKITFMLQTNGTLIDEKLIHMIKKYDINVGISLDGTDCKTNRARNFRNKQNVLDEVLDGIRKLVDEGINVGIFSVLTRYNVEGIKESIQKLSEIGVKSFVINPLVLWGNASDLNNIIVDQEEMVKSYKEIIDWLGEHNMTAEASEYLCERNIHWWYYAIKYGTKGYMCNSSPCGAGIHTLAFSPEGDTYLCDQYYGDEKFCLGNIFIDPVQEILNRVKQLELRTVFEIEECKVCQWRFVCSGGCTANSYYYSGDMKSLSPLCEAIKEILEYISIRTSEGIIL